MSDIPEYFFVPSFRGRPNVKMMNGLPVIKVGLCVDGPGEYEPGSLAHAHNHHCSEFGSKVDPSFGWICVTEPQLAGVWERQRDGTVHVVEPSPTLLHELAHILSPDHGHDGAWVYEMGLLKQTVSSYYGREKEFREILRSCNNRA